MILAENELVAGKKRGPKRADSNLLIPTEVSKIAAMTRLELIQVVPRLSEDLSRELVMQVKLVKRQSLLTTIMSHSPHVSVRQMIAVLLKRKLVIGGQDFTFAPEAKRGIALKKHLQNLCTLFPNGDYLLENLDLAELVFEKIHPLEVTPERLAEGVRESANALKWLIQQGGLFFPVLDNDSLGSVFVRQAERGSSILPNLAKLKKTPNLIELGFPLVETFNPTSGKWFFGGSWGSWGYSRQTGYWKYPRGRLIFKGRDEDVKKLLFGKNWLNICDMTDYLDLNPRHWVKRSSTGEGKGLKESFKGGGLGSGVVKREAIRGRKSLRFEV
jgi:hypothetical protein